MLLSLGKVSFKEQKNKKKLESTGNFIKSYENQLNCFRNINLYNIMIITIKLYNSIIKLIKLCNYMYFFLVRLFYRKIFH